VAGFPFTLVTGRVLQQYNVGSMTGRTPGDALAPDDVLELAPEDADALGLGAGGDAEVESRWGRTRLRARASARTPRGCAFLSFHHLETHANALLGPQRDPESNCPEYKVTAVRIRPVAR
jgi:predicted molibdopterin-dependent oxidoreductase YjgC